MCKGTNFGSLQIGGLLRALISSQIDELLRALVLGGSITKWAELGRPIGAAPNSKCAPGPASLPRAKNKPAERGMKTVFFAFFGRKIHGS